MIADKIFRKAELPSVVGLKRTQIEAMIARGEFPKPIRLSDGGRAVGWLSSEIVAWQQSRKAQRDGHRQLVTINARLTGEVALAAG